MERDLFPKSGNSVYYYHLVNEPVAILQDDRLHVHLENGVHMHMYFLSDDENNLDNTCNFVVKNKFTWC